MRNYLNTFLFLLLFTLSPYFRVNAVDDLNGLFANRLQGKGLRTERLVEGMMVPLHSVILAPRYEKSKGGMESEALATISFNYNDLTNEFVTKFFNPDDTVIRILHLFAARGVEAVLTKDNLQVTLHPGIAFHLRNDVHFYPEFRTFRDLNIRGTVTRLSGEFLISRDQDVIMQKLADVWTLIISGHPCILGKNCFKAADGSYYGTVDRRREADLPPYFPPRVE